MFGKMAAKRYGKEIYGEIIEIKDDFWTTRPMLPQKKVIVRYVVEHKEYYVTQYLLDVLSKHEKTLWVGNYIRVLIDDKNPEYAYINEYDYPEYDL